MKNIWLEYHHVKTFCERLEADEIELVGLGDALSEIISDAFELEFGYCPRSHVVVFIMGQIASLNEQRAADRELARQIDEIAAEMQRMERLAAACALDVAV